MTRKSGILLLANLLLATYLVVGTVWAGEAIEGSAQAEAAGAQCVRPTDYMRRNHFEVIKHQRNITVHQGVRQTDDSLAKCIDCHARKDAAGEYVAVNAVGQFCDGCHDYVAVTITCFSCHTSIPGGK